MSLAEGILSTLGAPKLNRLSQRFQKPSRLTLRAQRSFYVHSEWPEHPRWESGHILHFGTICTFDLADLVSSMLYTGTVRAQGKVFAPSTQNYTRIFHKYTDNFLTHIFTSAGSPLSILHGCPWDVMTANALRQNSTTCNWANLYKAGQGNNTL